MSEQSSKTVIGAFVVGALALVVIGVMIFGSGKFMKKTNKYILFFEGSVKGLTVGSSVAFRGVHVGSVMDITLRVDPKDMTSHIPVIIEVEPDRIEVVGGVRTGDPSSNIRKLIERGMRAQLATESLVTGLLMIEFDYHPDVKARLVGKDTKYPEIPTIPSTFEKMTKKIMNLPIEDLFTKLVTTVETINSLMASPEIPQIIHSLKLSMEDARKFINDLDAQVGPLASSVEGTLGEFSLLAKNADKEIKPLVSDVRATVKDYGKLAKDIDRHVDPIGKDAGKAIKVAISTLRRAESTIKEIEDEFSKDSVMTNALKTALRELAAASRSIRVWADYLERHPEALIRGKGGYRR